MSQPAQAAPGTAGARSLGLDLALYLGFALFALVTALLSEFATHRIWGCYAAAGYGLAAAHTTWRLLRQGRGSARRWSSRWAGIATIFVLALLAPLVHLVLRRRGGGDWHPDPAAWSAQPEVWVIERSASLLLRTGTPYVDVTALGRPPVVNDYTPYGPVMAVFGVPRALIVTAGLDTSSIAMALTDARLVFAAVAVACVLASLRLLGHPRVPVAAAQLAVVSPATALTWAVAGPDLAVLGLLVLALVFAVRGNAAVAGLSLALVISAKLTAAPAILVLLVLLANRGTRSAWIFSGALVATTAAIHLPVILLDPRAFIEHVIAFPAGAGVVESPAASPLPGHLIADTGPAGHTIALVLLALAAVIIAAWIVLRPPATGSDAALRIAVGLGTATLLTPATRWGYLVYPLVMLGARLCLPDLASTPNVPDTPTARSTKVTRAGEQGR